MRRMWVGLMIGALVSVAVTIAAEPAAAGKSPAWLSVRSIALPYKFGELPTRARQSTFGRFKLDHIARVSSAEVQGRKLSGDLLVITGEYQNLTTQASYWTEGYAFTFGTDPTRCTLDTCGPLPKGAWDLMTHAFSTPVVDYPKTRKGLVGPHMTLSFREVIRMPPGSLAGTSGSTSTTPTTTTSAASANPVIHSLRDIWVLPIYGAFNYFNTPFPPSELIRLSSYFGQTEIPNA